jgi:hypothetical protein
VLSDEISLTKVNTTAAVNSPAKVEMH